MALRYVHVQATGPHLGTMTERRKPESLRVEGQRNAEINRNGPAGQVTFKVKQIESKKPVVGSGDIMTDERAKAPKASEGKDTDCSDEERDRARRARKLEEDRASFAPIEGLLHEDEFYDEEAVQDSDDWNGRFQEALGLPEETDDERYRKWERLTTVNCDFVAAAVTYGRTIISEYFLDCKDKSIKMGTVGGLAGGQKYLWRGILFKLAEGSGEPYWGNDEAAAKAAGHDLRGATHYLQTRVKHLHFALQCAIDYKGFRMTAQAVLPVDSSTLRYGTADGAKTVHNEDKELDTKMKAVAEKLNLRSHTIKDKVMHSACDIEGHLGRDKRHYVLDFARSFPPESPYTVEHLRDLLPDATPVYVNCSPEIGADGKGALAIPATIWEAHVPIHKGDLRKEHIDYTVRTNNGQKIRVRASQVKDSRLCIYWRMLRPEFVKGYVQLLPTDQTSSKSLNREEPLQQCNVSDSGHWVDRRQANHREPWCLPRSVPRHLHSRISEVSNESEGTEPPGLRQPSFRRPAFKSPPEDRAGVVDSIGGQEGYGPLEDSDGEASTGEPSPPDSEDLSGWQEERRDGDEAESRATSGGAFASGGASGGAAGVTSSRALSRQGQHRQATEDEDQTSKRSAVNLVVPGLVPFNPGHRALVIPSDHAQSAPRPGGDRRERVVVPIRDCEDAFDEGPAMPSQASPETLSPISRKSSPRSPERIKRGMPPAMNYWEVGGRRGVGIDTESFEKVLLGRGQGAWPASAEGSWSASGRYEVLADFDEDQKREKGVPSGSMGASMMMSSKRLIRKGSSRQGNSVPGSIHMSRAEVNSQRLFTGRRYETLDANEVQLGRLLGSKGSFGSRGDLSIVSGAGGASGRAGPRDFFIEDSESSSSSVSNRFYPRDDEIGSSNAQTGPKELREAAGLWGGASVKSGEWTRVPLSPDALSGFSKADRDRPLRNHEVHEATEVMLDHNVAVVAETLQGMDREVQESLDFAIELHRHGVNMRHLGKVRSLLPAMDETNSTLHDLLLTEMLARTLKNIMRSYQRNWMKAKRSTSEQGMRRLVVDFLNLVTGVHKNSRAFWEKVVVGILQRFGMISLTPEERGDLWTVVSRKSHLLKECIAKLAEMQGLDFMPAVQTQFASTDPVNFRFVVADIKEIRVIVRCMHILDYGGGVMLSMQAKRLEAACDMNSRIVTRLRWQAEQNFRTAHQSLPDDEATVTQLRRCRDSRAFVFQQPAAPILVNRPPSEEDISARESMMAPENTPPNDDGNDDHARSMESPAVVGRLKSFFGRFSPRLPRISLWSKKPPQAVPGPRRHTSRPNVSITDADLGPEPDYLPGRLAHLR